MYLEAYQPTVRRSRLQKLLDYNIVLIGFYGSWEKKLRSLIILITMFAMEVVEMDQLIAEREGMSISDIFETLWEEYFRNIWKPIF